MELILIGYWASERDDSWPDVTSFIDHSWDPDERFDVVHHLRRGMLARAWMGLSTCRICGELNGSLDLTDGTYLWPEGLAHYVAEHGVRLPARFVEHARQLRASFEDADVERTWWKDTSGP